MILRFSNLCCSNLLKKLLKCNAGERTTVVCNNLPRYSEGGVYNYQLFDIFLWCCVIFCDAVKVSKYQKCTGIKNILLQTTEDGLGLWFILFDFIYLIESRCDLRDLPSNFTVYNFSLKNFVFGFLWQYLYKWLITLSLNFWGIITSAPYNKQPFPIQNWF